MNIGFWKVNDLGVHGYWSFEGHQWIFDFCKAIFMHVFMICPDEWDWIHGLIM